MNDYNKFLTVTAALCIGLFVAGCLTRGEAYTKKTLPDGTVIESRASIFGTGDKASEVAAEGLFADGTDEDLGAGFKQASAKQTSTGIDGTLAGMGTMFQGLAQLASAMQAAKTPAIAAQSASVASDADTVNYSPATAAAATEAAVDGSSSLAAKIKEAKEKLKPLVVVAGNTGCGYCTRLDAALDADTEFLTSPDFVLYRETSPWATNAAGKWTGGGLFPVVRVTEWDADGKIVCDTKLNRPAIADIKTAITKCFAK